jgi:hypothetical protein
MPFSLIEKNTLKWTTTYYEHTQNEVKPYLMDSQFLTINSLRQK